MGSVLFAYILSLALSFCLALRWRKAWQAFLMGATMSCLLCVVHGPYSVHLAELVSNKFLPREGAAFVTGGSPVPGVLLISLPVGLIAGLFVGMVAAGHVSRPQQQRREVGSRLSETNRILVTAGLAALAPLIPAVVAGVLVLVLTRGVIDWVQLTFWWLLLIGVLAVVFIVRTCRQRTG